MADKNRPDPSSDKAGDIAHDDPFAELARLIAPEWEQPGEGVRQDQPPETSEDLADELLREFESYSRPDEPAIPEAAPVEPTPEPVSFHYGADTSSTGVGDWHEKYEAEEPAHRQDVHEAEATDTLGDAFLADELERSMRAFDEPVSEDREPPVEERAVPSPYVSFELPTYSAPPVRETAETPPAEENWFEDPQTDVPDASEEVGVPDFEFDPAAFADLTDPHISDDQLEPEPARVYPDETATAGRSDDLESWQSVADEAELDLNLDEIEQELFALELDNEQLEPTKPALQSQPQSGPLESVKPVAAQKVEDDDVFDPTAFVAPDERLAVVDEMDLPTVSQDETEHVAVQPDPYEFDLDEELANVMASQATPVDPLNEAPLYEPEPAASSSYAYDLVNEQRYDDNIESVLGDDFQQPPPINPQRPEYNDRFDEDNDDRRMNWLAVTFMGYGRVLALGVVGLCLIAVLVFAGLRYSGDAGDSEPLVITADNSSVKEAPEDPGGEVVPNQDNAVFNNVSGTLSAEPRQGSLIASDQQPADVEATAPNPLADSTNGQSSDQTSLDEGIQPRKVRTIIVRPDGTLVERKAPAMTSTASDQAETQPSADGFRGGSVAQQPTGDGNASDADAQVSETAPADNTADGIGVVGDTGAIDTETPAIAQGDTAFDIYNVPIPTRRPAQPTSSASNTVSTTTAQPAAAPQASQSAVAGNQVSSPYAMQIASLPSQQDAEQAYRRLAAKYPAIMGGRSVEFRAAAIEGKGTYYRVRINASSLNDAIALCERYRAEGGNCFVPR